MEGVTLTKTYFEKWSSRLAMLAVLLLGAVLIVSCGASSTVPRSPLSQPKWRLLLR